MDLKELMEGFGVNPIGAVGGIIGGVITIVMNKDNKSWRMAVAQMLSAISFSSWGTEWVANLGGKWLSLNETPSTYGLTGLCLGLCGMMLVRGVRSIGNSFEKNPFNFNNNKEKGNSNNKENGNSNN